MLASTCRDEGRLLWIVVVKNGGEYSVFVENVIPHQPASPPLHQKHYKNNWFYSLDLFGRKPSGESVKPFLFRQQFENCILILRSPRLSLGLTTGFCT